MVGLITKSGRLLQVVLGLTILCGTSVTAQSSEQGGQERDNERLMSAADKQGLQILRETNEFRRASELAHERYATARLESYFHGRTSWGSFFGVEALFPALRSDRMYLVVFRLHWPTETSKERNVVLCYQRTNNKLKLVYSFRYIFPDRVAYRAQKPRTFLEYLHSSGFVPVGRISRNARKDISAVRDYVRYGVVPYTGTLGPYMTSEISKNGLVDPATYQIENDPFTNKEIKEEEFYRRYGLPIAKRELELLKRSGK